MRLPTSGLPTIRRPLSMIWKSPLYGPVTVSSLTLQNVGNRYHLPAKARRSGGLLSSNRPLPV